MPVGQSRAINELDPDALQQFHSDTGVNLKRQAPALCRFLEQTCQALEVESRNVKEQIWPDSHPVIDQITRSGLANAEHLQHWLNQ